MNEFEFERTPVLLKTGLKQYLPIMSEILGTHEDSAISSPLMDTSAKIQMVMFMHSFNQCYFKAVHS